MMKHFFSLLRVLTQCLLMLSEFPPGFSVPLRERESQKVIDLVLCSRSTLATKEAEGRRQPGEMEKKVCLF